MCIGRCPTRRSMRANGGGEPSVAASSTARHCRSQTAPALSLSLLRRTDGSQTAANFAFRGQRPTKYGFANGDGDAGHHASGSGAPPGATVALGLTTPENGVSTAASPASAGAPSLAQLPNANATCLAPPRKGRVTGLAADPAARHGRMVMPCRRWCR